MARSARPLLLDAPLALLIGMVAIGFGRGASYWAHGPTGPGQNRPGPGGPPWSGGPGFEAPPPNFTLEEPYELAVVIWASIVMIGVAIRRIRPRTGFAISVIGTTGYLAVGLPLGPVLAAPALSLMALAARVPVRRWVPWSLLLLPMLWAAFARERYLGLTQPDLYNTLLLLSVVTIFPALIATIRRNRRDAGRRARELELRRATYQERLRIARDVHDVVGHSLSVINMQAGVALYLLAKGSERDIGADPHQLEESLQAIRSSSKNALDELRATLAVFRGENGERAPVAGLDRVPDLVQALRAAGREVDLQVTGELAGIPGPIDIAGYRIVQEALTNVAKHTVDATATIQLRRTDQALIITITDNGPGIRTGRSDRSPGQGLVGMAERAEAVGGSVSTGPRPEGGFIVEATFPLPEGSRQA